MILLPPGMSDFGKGIDSCRHAQEPEDHVAKPQDSTIKAIKSPGRGTPEEKPADEKPIFPRTWLCDF